VTDQPEGGKAAPVSDTEWAAFYDVANDFLDVANQLIGIEPSEEIAAAFLYACARYNSFTMQAQAEDPTTIDDETVEYLASELERHLREHMAQSLGAETSAPDNPAGSPRQVIDLIKRLNDRDEDDLSKFLDLGDRFINVANGVNPPTRVSRISAAFMHACARFNVYCMQGLGHPPETVDEDLVAAFRQAYVNLVNYHLQETLVAPRG
jgi:hypothetical protein